MKKIFWIAAIAALMSACNVAEQKQQSGAEVACGVTATFKQPVMEDATKALDNNLDFSFKADDQICVYSDEPGECMVYTLIPTSGNAAAFNVKGFNLEDATYGAVYPYFKPAVDPSCIQFSLAGQDQKASGDAAHLSDYDLNFAQSAITDNTGTFDFEHLVAWLQIKFQSNIAQNIKEIVVSADEGVANTITLNAVTGELDAAASSASESIVLKLNGGEGIALAAGDSFVGYVTIPAGEYTNLNIFCGSYNKTISGAKQREAGHVYPINLASKLNAPVASPASGQVLRGSIVTLAAEDGADIRYTLDGTDPTAESTLYTSAGIEIPGKCTLKAIAVKDGWDDSDVMTESYEIPICPKPTVSVDADGVVTMTTSVEDAVIYYTLDGTPPVTTSAVYDADDKPVLDGENITVMAFAVSPRYEESPITIYYYRVVDVLGGDFFMKIFMDDKYTSKLCFYFGSGIYNDSYGVPSLILTDGKNCIIGHCLYNCPRYIKIQAVSSSSVDIIASDISINERSIWDMEAVATLDFTSPSYTGRYDFPESNEYKYIAIRPRTGTEISGIEVGF